MKTILIATDLSENAEQAAHYGYALASQVKADVVLCNAMIFPAEIPQAGFVVWPSEEYNELMESSGLALDALKQRLVTTPANGSHVPHIKCVNEAGVVADTIEKITEQHGAFLVVAGTHAHNGIAEFIMGDHTKNLIDGVTRPLLIVPPTSVVKPVKRVALALDLTDPRQELATVLRVLPIVKALDAELLLAHISLEKDHNLELHNHWEQALKSLAAKAGYSNTDTLLIKDDNVEAGLNWLCKYGNIQMLAMAHHAQGFFTSIFKGSHTKKMADRACVPLLVLPLHQ